MPNWPQIQLNGEEVILQCGDERYSHRRSHRVRNPGQKRRPGLGNLLQSPFMLKKARTLEFRHQLTVKGDRMRYEEATVLDIYRDHHFDHTDQNTLQRQ